jgi:hypothetical protein
VTRPKLLSSSSQGPVEIGCRGLVDACWSAICEHNLKRTLSLVVGIWIGGGALLRSSEYCLVPSHNYVRGGIFHLSWIRSGYLKDEEGLAYHQG